MPVDKSKFRTCNQTSFCSQNRRPINSLYTIDPTTIQTDDNIFDARLYNGVWIKRDPLQVLLRIINRGTAVSLQINDIYNTDTIHRYYINDVIKPGVWENNDKLDIHWKHSNTVTSATYNIDTNSYQIDIQYNPFIVTFTVNNHIIQVINAESKLVYEQQHQSNPRPTDTDNITEMNPLHDKYDYDSSTMWLESFGSHIDNKPYGDSAVGIDITYSNTQHIYGLAEHASTYGLKNTDGSSIDAYSDPYRLWNLDVFEYDLDVPMSLYGSIPFIVAHNKYTTSGIIWLNAAETYVDISQHAATHDKQSYWLSETGAIDMYVLLGPTPDILYKSYGELTGYTAIPQYFALAYHQCRWNYKSSDDVLTVDSSFDSYNIPYDVIWLDIEHTDGKRYFTWDQNNFPDPVAMQNKLADKGRKLVTIVDPHIKRDPNYYVHNEANDNKYYVRQGKIRSPEMNDYDGWCWSGSVSYIDYTLQHVRDWWSSLFSYNKYQYSTNNLYVWNDMNEPSVFNGPEITMPKDNLHSNGLIEHRDVHNIYGQYLFNATYHGLLQRNSDQNDRPFVLSRSFYIGSQQYGAIWTGDNKAEWSHLQASNHMLLSLNTVAMSFSGADVGGFFGNPSSELMTRWYQTAIYQPFFRSHAHIDSKRREPYLYDEPYLSIIRQSIQRRYTLLPYLYTIFYTAHTTGMPVMRPLWMQFTTDTTIYSEQDTFMLGAGLLIKPVVTESTYTLDVYLPTNQQYNTVWYVYDNTNIIYKGGQTIQFDTPLERGAATFYHGGSIITRKDRQRRSTTQSYYDPYTIVVACDSNGNADDVLYVDDGKSYDYINHNRYLYVQYTMSSYTTLTAKQLNIHSTYNDVVHIERIVLLGMQSMVHAITLHTNNQDTNLTYIQDHTTVTIKKPDVLISSEWMITVHYRDQEL